MAVHATIRHRDDALGEKARTAIASLGVDTTLLQSTTRFPTGTATVTVSPQGGASFAIARPAAYDAVAIAGDTLARLIEWGAGWMYHGTLFPSCADARALLNRLAAAVPGAVRV